MQVLLSRNSEFAEPPATVQSSKKMVYQVFDTFRPSVSAVSCFASGSHAKMRYSLETESSRSHRRRCRVRKKWCIKCLTFSPAVCICHVVAVQPLYIHTKRLCRACQPYRVKRAVQPLCFAGLPNPYFYTKRMCRPCQPYHVKRAVQPFFCAGLSNPNLARPPRFFL